MSKMPERDLAQAWRRSLWEGRRLSPDLGGPVEVLHPGRDNTDRGPDFVDAFLAMGVVGLVRGDVEVHRRTGDWRAHGHHRDPTYNGVVLQVVWGGKGAPAVRQDGRRVPTLRLDGVLSADEVRRSASLPCWPPAPCAGVAASAPVEAGHFLDEAGERRFGLKAGRFAAELALAGPGQVLYRGLMGALGYAKNKAPFRKLAERVPLELVEGEARGREPAGRLAVVQALLLGSSGLLPGWTGPPLAGTPEELQRWWQALGPWEPLLPTEWRFFRIRPENSPIRRLAGACQLLARHADEGLLRVLGEALVGGGVREARQRLEQALVTGEGDRFVGPGRAREMVVNVVLPFFAAWAQAGGDGGLRDRARELFRAYPALPSNAVTRRLRGLLGLAGEGPARRQQGLLHLDAAFCRARRCGECPASVASPHRPGGHPSL